MDQERALSNPPSQTSPPPKMVEGEFRQMTPDESRHELRQAIRGSNEVLAKATTVLVLFPDNLSVDRAKVTVTKRSFIRSAEVMSIRVEDILNVTATVGPIFGSVKIISRVMNNERPYRIGIFWRSDALRMKRIIQGYVIALQRKIDCSNLPAKELADMLDRLGEDAHG